MNITVVIITISILIIPVMIIATMIIMMIISIITIIGLACFFGKGNHCTQMSWDVCCYS